MEKELSLARLLDSIAILGGIFLLITLVSISSCNSRKLIIREVKSSTYSSR